MSVEPLSSLDRSTLRERALEALRSAIISGRYHPGDHLGEVELGQHLGVSRGTVREALRHLQQEGLVTVGNRNRLLVNSLTPQQVRELFRVRAALEGLAAAEIIASSKKDEAVAALRDALSQLAAGDTGDFAERLEADLGFHLRLCQLSGNSMLVDAWRYLEGRIRVTIMNGESAGTPSMISRDRHAPIVDAIERGDAAAGWNIAILDLDEAGAKDAATEVAERHGVQAVGVGCDITDAASVENALAVVADTVPPVGALVNNAGITSPVPFLEVTSQEWERVFAVNVRGSYNVTRQLAPGMAERGFGRIVFLSSVSAERGGGVFGGVAYSAAKAGQLGFARALARELGPQGVTVNSVAPGLIDTDITGGALTGEREAQLLAGVPVGRKGTPADVADLITYLCREESGYITGATYDVNGGSHIH